MSDRLQEIRARLDAATPGPWHDVYPFIVANEYMQGGICTVEIGQQPDADLIAHAPADIAWLLDEVERLRNTSLSAANPLCDGGDA